MRVSRRGRSGRRRSWARSNGAEPYLITCGMHSGAGGATAKIDGINCARGGRAGGCVGGWSSERYEVKTKRQVVMKSALGRQ